MNVGEEIRVRVLNLETLISMKEQLASEKDVATLPVLRRTLLEQFVGVAHARPFCLYAEVTANSRKGRARSTLQRRKDDHQFGFVLSGPVFIPKVYNGRDKTFWMVNFEGVIKIVHPTNTGKVTVAGHSSIEVPRAILRYIWKQAGIHEKP